MHAPQNRTKTWLWAWLLMGGLGTGACSAGGVHTVLSPPEEQPSAPRPDQHGPDNDESETSGPAVPGITPAEGTTPDPDDTSVPMDANQPQSPPVPQNPGGAGGSTSPNDVVGSPNQTSGSPNDIASSTNGDVDSPNVVVGSPNVVVGSPNVVVGSPNVVVGSPNDVVNSPNVVVGSPDDIVVGPTEPNAVTAPPVASNPNGGAGNPNSAPPAPLPRLSPREACHQAWLAQGHQSRYGDPFAMPAAQDANWWVSLRVQELDVEARPLQYLEVSLDPTGAATDTCMVPIAWSVEILSPGIAFDPFLMTYQRVEPIRRLLSTGGLAMEEKSFTSWQDFSDRVFWLTWSLRPYAPTVDQLQAVQQALRAPVEQEASWDTAVRTIEDKQQPGLAVAIGLDADPTHAPYWGVLSDAVRAGVRGRDTTRAFLPVTPASSSNSFHSAITAANVWPWHRFATWDTSTQQPMACDPDAEAFERRCDQVLPAYASRVYREILAQNMPIYVHMVWERRPNVEAFVTTVRVDPGGSVAVEKTQRFDAIPDFKLPSLPALHGLENL